MGRNIFSKGNLKTASPVNKNYLYFGTTSITDTLRIESLPKKYSPIKSTFSTNVDVNHFSKCDSSVENTPECFPISRTIPGKSKKTSAPSLNKCINKDTGLKAVTHVIAENSLSSEVAPDNFREKCIVKQKKTEIHGTVLNKIDRTIKDVRSFQITDIDIKEKI